MSPPPLAGAPERVGIMVLAAHPDDETIGAGALLARFREPAVVLLTDGAPRDRRFWPVRAPDTVEAYADLRRRELARALAEGGIGAARTVGLGAADQEATLHLGALARALAGLLTSLRPAVLVTHPYEGGHPDHDAAAFVARAAAALLRRAGRRPPRVVEMTSYHAAGDALETGRFLPGGGGGEVVRTLEDGERARKERMLAAFESQAAVLAPFRADVERFRRAPPSDLGRPPHDGPLWYERCGFPMSGERWRSLARQAARELRVEVAT